MAAELGLLPLTQLQKLPQSQHNPNLTACSWMWNPKQGQESEDDSWEVRAFAEDTGNIMGTTWPPRSYTCNFCRREFRSAQALGGHMNVHRRDRARLHQTQPPHNSSSTTASSPTLIIPTQEFVANGAGLCLLYQLPNPNNNGGFTPIDSPSTLLSISPYPPSINYSGAAPSGMDIHSSLCHSSKAQQHVSMENDKDEIDSNIYKKDSDIEELDLELRLGY